MQDLGKLNFNIDIIPWIKKMHELEHQYIRFY